MTDKLIKKLKKIAETMLEQGIDRQSVKFQVGEYRYAMNFSKIKIPTLDTTGISSRIKGKLAQVLFLDYDMVEIEVVETDAEAIQDIYECGNIHIFQTAESSFHALCLDYFSVPVINEIQRLSNCDRAYFRGPLYNYHRGWVLRYKEKGEKPKPSFVKTIESIWEGERPQSTFHVLKINEEYDLDIVLTNPDGITKGTIDSYKAVAPTEEAG